MGGAKLVHEGVPHVRPALFEQPGADRQLVRHGEVAAAPGAHDDEQRKELDRLFGEAVDCLLLVAGIVGAGEEAVPREPFQTVGEDAGGHTFLGPIQPLAEMAAVSEPPVPVTDGEPALTEHLPGKIDTTYPTQY